MRVNIYFTRFSTSVRKICILIRVMRVTIEMHTKTHTGFHLKGVSGFHSEVDENFVRLNYYAASSENSSPTFRDNLSVTSSRVKNPFLTLEDGIDTMSRNVGKELPLLLRNNPEDGSFHIKYSLFLADLNQNRNLRKNLMRLFKIYFHRNMFSFSRAANPER